MKNGTKIKKLKSQVDVDPTVSRLTVYPVLATLYFGRRGTRFSCQSFKILRSYIMGFLRKGGIDTTEYQINYNVGSYTVTSPHYYAGSDRIHIDMTGNAFFNTNQPRVSASRLGSGLYSTHMCHSISFTSLDSVVLLKLSGILEELGNFIDILDEQEVRPRQKKLGGYQMDEFDQAILDEIKISMYRSRHSKGHTPRRHTTVKVYPTTKTKFKLREVRNN
jgi:hypothetical protein